MGPTASRLSSVNLADFLARKDLADFLLEALLDFLADGFAHSVCNISSYLNITNLPSFAEWQPFSLFDESFSLT